MLFHSLFFEILTTMLGNSKLKGALSRLRQFLATGSPLEMMKSVFYFISKALFVHKIFKSLSRLFGHVAKRLDEKGKVNFKTERN